MSLSILAVPAARHKFDYLLKSFGDKDDVLILCATAAQEGDIGRSFARGASTSLCEHPPEFRSMSFASFAASMWNRWGDQRGLVGAAVRHKTMSDVLDRLQRRRTIPSALLSPGGRVLLSRLASSYISQSGKGDYLTMEGTSDYKACIKSILEEYFRELEENGYIEHQYALHCLADIITGEHVDFPAGKIMVVGFRDFSSAQLGMLRALAKKSELRVLLDYDKDNPATEHLLHTLEQLIDGGGKLLDVTVLPDRSEKMREEVSRREGLSWLQNNFLIDEANQALPPSELLNGQILTLGKAQGKAAELALMADFAQAAHEMHPHEPKALLVSCLSSYAHSLSRELEQRKIPFEIDIKTPFGATGFGAALFALLRICVDEDALLAASAFVTSPYSGFSSEEALELDTKWRHFQADSAKILTQLSFHESGACAFLKLVKGYNHSARIGDWYSIITQMYACAAKEQFFSPDRKDLSSLSSFDLMQEAAAQKAAISALQELYELRYGIHSASLGSESARGNTQDEKTAIEVEQEDCGQPGKRILHYDPIVSAAELYAALFDVSVAQTPRQGSPAILISEPSRVYGRSFHTVIAGGLFAQDERERSDPSLEARLAASLARTKIADVGLQQQLEHYNIIDSAQEKLYLVSQSRELSGEDLRPGDFLSAIEDCLGKEACEELTVSKGQDSVIAAQSFANAEKQDDFKRLLAGQSIPQIKIPEHGLDANYDFGYGGGARVSPSTLEGYAYCSYKWFLDSFVRGRDLDRGFGAAEQGKLAHQVLRIFYERLSLEGVGRRITEDNLADALALFDRVFDEEQTALKEKSRFSAAEEAELINIWHHMKNFLKCEPEYAPEFIPSYFEYRFGFEDSEKLDLGIGLPLTGVIDRIDVREDDRAAIIIDYKRSIKMGQIEAQASNKIMQGVLYRKAAEKALGLRTVAHDYRSYLNPSQYKVSYSQDDNPPERPLGLPKIGRKKTHWGDTARATELAIGSIMESARMAAEGLRMGAVGIREKNSANCSYCIFSDCIHWKPRWKK